MPEQTTTDDRPAITVDAVETEPITPAQHTRAVTALSALIAEWNNARHF